MTGTALAEAAKVWQPQAGDEAVLMGGRPRRNTAGHVESSRNTCCRLHRRQGDARHS